jgi:peptidoglycan/xylan/chitin deacetylase (PgdA/CDA1 family)
LSAAADLAARTTAALIERMSGARLTVLIFHRVLERPDPLLPSVPDARRFEAMMRMVQQCFHVVSLPQAIAALAAGMLPHRAAAITFDDGYADNAIVAVPILERLGMTATFFIASGFLEGGRMWNDTVIETIRSCSDDVLDLSSAGLGRHPVASDRQRGLAIDAVLGQLKYVEFERRLEITARVAECAAGPLPGNLMMSRAQVRSLVEHGMTVGAHTMNHPILANIADRIAEDEIAGSREALEAIVGAPVTLFAYPNGKPGQDYDARHVAMLKRAGFSGAVSTAAGAAGRGADPFQIPRFTPWSWQPLRFRFQLVQNLQRTCYEVAV